MAIEREIPKDISKYEAKLIGPLTTRQVIFGVPGAIVGVGCFFLTNKFLPSDVSTFISIFFAAPFLLCGWVKVYGVHFEKFVSMVFISQFVAPKHRKYRTENLYSDLRDIKVVKKEKKKKNKKIVYSGDLTRYD